VERLGNFCFDLSVEAAVTGQEIEALSNKDRIRERFRVAGRVLLQPPHFFGLRAETQLRAEPGQQASTSLSFNTSLS
jgi:hypothetical protein